MWRLLTLFLIISLSFPLHAEDPQEILNQFNELAGLIPGLSGDDSGQGSQNGEVMNQVQNLFQVMGNITNAVNPPQNPPQNPQKKGPEKIPKMDQTPIHEGTKKVKDRESIPIKIETTYSCYYRDYSLTTPTILEYRTRSWDEGYFHHQKDFKDYHLLILGDLKKTKLEKQNGYQVWGDQSASGLDIKRQSALRGGKIIRPMSLTISLTA